MYYLIDTETNEIVTIATTEAAALSETPYLPADCVPQAETWEDVIEVAKRHVDGIPGVVEGYRVERDSLGLEIFE